MARPTGVTVIAVLAAIFGVLGVLGGLMALAGGALLGSVIVANGGAANVGPMLMIGGLLALAGSVLTIAFAFGCWTAKPWAWMLGLVSAGLNVISAVLGGIGTGFFVTLAINGLIVYYLMTPPVKAYFGRS